MYDDQNIICSYFQRLPPFIKLKVSRCIVGKQKNKKALNYSIVTSSTPKY